MISDRLASLEEKVSSLEGMQATAVVVGKRTGPQRTTRWRKKPAQERRKRKRWLRSPSGKKYNRRRNKIEKKPSTKKYRKRLKNRGVHRKYNWL